MNYREMMDDVCAGNERMLSKAISLVINEAPGHEELLTNDTPPIPVIGITGPPGAGKSTLTDKLIGELIADGSRVAVLCIDPSSPYSKGAILGDRIRMSDWYNNPSVFIRSLASRGSLGGLPLQANNLVRLLRAAPFDYILIETVGVGQSEVDISSLADCTIVVLVPESGDEIQLMKAGVMEIGDIYVVNKCDRPGADLFAADIKQMLRSSPGKQHIPVIKTIANARQGIGELVSAIKNSLSKD